ncbi:MAG: hypothetical protein QUS07_09530 [Methanothrix sp.]|nr:hypothetical protein [Methanothrix sp.]
MAIFNREEIPKKTMMILLKGLVQFEAEIQGPTEIRSRIIWPDSEGPWIEGGLQDLMVHFTYAAWTAYNLNCALSMVLSSHDEGLSRSVSDMMTKVVSVMGAIQVAEIRLTREALDELKRDRIEP